MIHPVGALKAKILMLAPEKGIVTTAKAWG